jgi:hypothetical protein
VTTIRTEKGQAKHLEKCRRANTTGDRVEEAEKEEEEEEESNRVDSEEDRLMEKELERLRVSKGNAPPLWTLEPDLVGMTQAGRGFVPRVQSNITLRRRQLGTQRQSEDKE